MIFIHGQLKNTYRHFRDLSIKSLYFSILTTGFSKMSVFDPRLRI
jgi:hypothetical protein